MLLNVTSSQYISMPQSGSLSEIDTSETASLSSATDHFFALSTEVVSSITTNHIEGLESSIQVPISTAYGTTSFRNNTSSPQYLVSNCTSSVQSNITIDRGLLSTLKTFTTSQVPTIEPSTTKLTTPLSTTFTSTSTSEIYSVFTSENSVYIIYDQEYKFTERSTTFNTHFPQTSVLQESNPPLTFTIPSNTITGDAKLYQYLSGALNTQDASDANNRRTGVIVGSTVGVVIGVVIVIFIGFIIIRNRRNVKNHSKKGFSHDIGKRVSCDEVTETEALSNPFLNVLNYKVTTNGEGKRDSFENGRDLHRASSSDGIYIAHPYYGVADHESGRFSYLSSYNESTESSIEETSSSASTITRPNIQQTNSFLREII
ncbi:CCN_G0006810.mRNA.1.CDS.1 [Saccharomyces cerevisiae]|nr:HLJ1_G0041850.mRNA.1.CDS.1 [Saccharomyces cerevisiae]CAI4309762.1 CCN_G0006810.mRNA.1.CDS.1 [Saccharomyces cerevisiae]CAI7176675.1 CCN_G0006810.mRNA.1.CDS.1 [Saccharomyces cerevisiae]